MYRRRQIPNLVDLGEDKLRGIRSGRIDISSFIRKRAVLERRRVDRLGTLPVRMHKRIALREGRTFDRESSSDAEDDRPKARNAFPIMVRCFTAMLQISSIRLALRYL